MHPLLLRWGTFHLYSYPVLFAVAFITGILITTIEAKKFSMSPEVVFKLGIQIFFVSLIGARLFFVVGAWKALPENSNFSRLILNGGFVFYGGLLCSMAYLFWKLPKMKISRNVFFSIAAPGLAFAHAVGRLGCFLNGCCFGSKCELPWSVRLPLNSQMPLKQTPFVHPSQLYEIIGLIFIGGLCLRLNRKKTPPKTWKIYLISYALLRFFVEFSRADTLRGQWGPLSTSQWISLGILLWCLFLDLKTKRGHNHRPNETRN